jgi:hypothetical protein
VSVNQLVSRSGTKVTRLMTCLAASDDTTNMRLGQGPAAATTHEVEWGLSKSPDRVRVC